MTNRRPLIRRWMLLWSIGFLACACSSDLFRPDKASVITRMEADPYEVDPDQTIRITVTVEDDDKNNLRYEWSADGGQFVLPADQATIVWKAPAVGGTFRITVTVSNEKKSATRSVSVTVRSFAKPRVEILSPKTGDYAVQFENLAVRAVAAHNNGIHHVSLFVNDALRETQSGQSSNQYNFSFTLSEPSGQAEIKVEATANTTGVTDRDSVRITVEGLVLGKSKARK